MHSAHEPMTIMRGADIMVSDCRHLAPPYFPASLAGKPNRMQRSRRACASLRALLEDAVAKTKKAAVKKKAARTRTLQTSRSSPESSRMAEMGERAVALLEVNAVRKEAEKEETEHKDFFKAMAGDQPFSFESQADGVAVTVTIESREDWDGDKLRAHFGEQVSEFRRQSTFQKVTVRELT